MILFVLLLNKASLLSDTLLNVFLAIAVDNLANAQELTAAEEQAAAQALEEVKNQSPIWESTL